MLFLHSWWWLSLLMESPRLQCYLHLSLNCLSVGMTGFQLLSQNGTGGNECHVWQCICTGSLLFDMPPLSLSFASSHTKTDTLSFLSGLISYSRSSPCIPLCFDQRLHYLQSRFKAGSSSDLWYNKLDHALLHNRQGWWPGFLQHWWVCAAFADSVFIFRKMFPERKTPLTIFHEWISMLIFKGLYRYSLSRRHVWLTQIRLLPDYPVLYF